MTCCYLALFVWLSTAADDHHSLSEQSSAVVRSNQCFSSIEQRKVVQHVEQREIRW